MLSAAGLAVCATGHPDPQRAMPRAADPFRNGGCRVAFFSAREDVAMDHLTKREQPDRSKINMHEAWEVKYWTHALGVSREKLQRAVDKVGNSAAAVRKELAA